MFLKTICLICVFLLETVFCRQDYTVSVLSEDSNAYCLECAHYEGETSDVDLHHVLLVLKSPNDIKCREWDNVTEVNAVNCMVSKELPPSYDGWKCSKSDNSFKLSLHGSSTTVKGVTRGCAPTREGDPYSESACYSEDEDNPYTQIAMTGLELLHEDLEVSDPGGTICLCHNDPEKEEEVCNEATSVDLHSYLTFIMVLVCLNDGLFTLR